MRSHTGKPHTEALSNGRSVVWLGARAPPGRPNTSPYLSLQLPQRQFATGRGSAPLAQARLLPGGARVPHSANWRRLLSTPTLVVDDSGPPALDLASARGPCRCDVVTSVVTSKTLVADRWLLAGAGHYISTPSGSACLYCHSWWPHSTF